MTTYTLDGLASIKFGADQIDFSNSPIVGFSGGAETVTLQVSLSGSVIHSANSQIQMTFNKIGNQVFGSFDWSGALGPIATEAAPDFIQITELVPEAFRPISDKYFPGHKLENGNLGQATLYMYAGGSMQIQPINGGQFAPFTPLFVPVMYFMYRVDI